MDVLDELKNFYDGFDGEKGYIGATEQGVLIPYFAVVKTEKPVVLIQYAIHAREYITTYLAIEQIKFFVRNGKFGTAYFIPAVNIDGIRICLSGRPLYKSNARGVDLNVNFDARWGTGKYIVRVAGAENYIGKYPFSESETRVLRDFTLDVKPNASISYHSKGNEIYWEFYQDEIFRERDYKIAKSISKTTGYPLKTAYGSAGGYKDWCIEKLRIPAFTIEVGSDSEKHPIEKNALSYIFERNKEVINVTLKALAEQTYGK